MINKKNVTHKDWISIIASLVQRSFDYLAYNTDNIQDKTETDTEAQTRYKKWSFPLTISSVNVTKSAVSYGFGLIFTEEISMKNFIFCTVKVVHWVRNILVENVGYSPCSAKLNLVFLLYVHLLECHPVCPVSLQICGLQFFQLQNRYPLCSSDTYCKFFVRLLLVFPILCFTLISTSAVSSTSDTSTFFLILWFICTTVLTAIDKLSMSVTSIVLITLGW